MPDRFQPRMKPERPPENPVLMRAIWILSGAIVLAGVVWALLIGHLFS